MADDPLAIAISGCHSPPPPLLYTREKNRQIFLGKRIDPVHFKLATKGFGMLKWILAAMILLTVYLLDQDAKHEFMRECQDNGVSRFACMALWRGNSVYPGGLR